MAKRVFMFLSIFLYFFTVCSSGTLVGFSYDARRNSAISSLTKTISFVKKNKVSPSQIRVFVADDTVLDALSNTGVHVDLYLNDTEVKNLRNSKASTISWLKAHLISFLPNLNITSIIVSTSSSNSMSHKQLHLLLPTLNSIHSALKSFNLDSQVKISVAFTMSSLEDLNRQHAIDLWKIVDFIKGFGSFIVVETQIVGELSMGDQFVASMIKSATSASTVLNYRDVPLVLNVKSSIVPSALEVSLFTNKMTKSMKNRPHILDRISGVFAEISPMEESEQRELSREEEQMFHSSHRELNSIINNKNSKSISETKITLHDTTDPPTPVNIPSANPTPTIITVPATNPVAITPTNPATTPITVPTTTPNVTTPINVPPTNPVNPPTAPPLSNPITTPITVPAPPVITNPGTNSVPPPGSVPITNPVTPPATISPPVGSGQTWCVAKAGAMVSALQVALDYACGVGGADCSAIQPTGSCYNPNTPQSHASYAFNSYFQKNPVPSSCDFKGVAMIVNTNPSTSACVFPTSSSSSGSSSSLLSPPLALNTSYPASPTPIIFGSGPPPGSSTSESIAAGLEPLFAPIILATFIATRMFVGV